MIEDSIVVWWSRSLQWAAHWECILCRHDRINSGNNGSGSGNETSRSDPGICHAFSQTLPCIGECRESGGEELVTGYRQQEEGAVSLPNWEDWPKGCQSGLCCGQHGIAYCNHATHCWHCMYPPRPIGKTKSLWQMWLPVPVLLCSQLVRVARVWGCQLARRPRPDHARLGMRHVHR